MSLEEIKDLLVEDSGKPIVVVVPQRFGPAGDNEEVRSQIDQRSQAIGCWALSDGLSLDYSHESWDGLADEIRTKGLENIQQRMDVERLSSLTRDMFSELPQLAPSVIGKDSAVLQLPIRMENRQMDMRDIHRLATLLWSAYSVTANRETNAYDIGADCLLSGYLWNTSVRRNALLANRFAAEPERDEERTIASSFQVGFRWLDGISNEDVLELRADDLVEAVRGLFRANHHGFVCGDERDFAEAFRVYESQVVRDIEQIRAELIESDRKIALRRRNSAISFSTATALGVVSLAFPALVPVAVGGLA